MTSINTPDRTRVPTTVPTTIPTTIPTTVRNVSANPPSEPVATIDTLGRINATLSELVAKIDLIEQKIDTLIPNRTATPLTTDREMTSYPEWRVTILGDRHLVIPPNRKQPTFIMPEGWIMGFMLSDDGDRVWTKVVPKKGDKRPSEEFKAICTKVFNYAKQSGLLRDARPILDAVNTGGAY